MARPPFSRRPSPLILPEKEGTRGRHSLIDIVARAQRKARQDAFPDAREVPADAMPTLIRLFIFVLVLAGLVFGGMVALTLFVDPGEKDITIKIPTRDLVAPPANANDPLGINALPAPVNIAPRESSEEPVAPPPADGAVSTSEPPPE